jgi:hypothetical protein
MDDDFKEWILKTVAERPVEEMLNDTQFICRLMNDVLWGRSKKFNRTKTNGMSQGLSLLHQEYTREVGEMAMLVCPKCKGSLVVFKDSKGVIKYKCNSCSAEYDKKPK